MYSGGDKLIKKRPAPKRPTANKKPSVSTVKKTTVHQSYLNWYVKNAKSGKAPTKKQAGDWWSKKATPAERKRWGV